MERNFLRENLHKHTQLYLAATQSPGPSSTLEADTAESSASENDHCEKQSLAETLTDDVGELAQREDEISKGEITSLPVTVQSGVPQAMNMPAAQIGRFTSALWEYASGIGSLPVYVETTISSYPPLFEVTVSFQERSSSGRARTKKTAKHHASKVMCELLQLQVL